MGNMFQDKGHRTPKDYIASLDDPRKSHIEEIDALIRKALPKQKPLMLSGMLAYGPYNYESKSGRAGEWALILLSSRANYIALYVCAIDGKTYLAEKYKKELPKAKIGKSCITFKKPEDVDLKVITKILKEAEKLGAMNAVN